MDPIFDRLGRLFRSNNPFSSSGSPMDDDERAAMEELEAELNAPPGATPRKPATQGSRSYQQQRRQESSRQEEAPPRPSVDPVLARAYAALGLSPSAGWDEINAAHRTLLKKHHPDRHAGNEALMKQATAQSQKINEAYQALKKHLGR